MTRKPDRSLLTCDPNLNPTPDYARRPLSSTNQNAIYSVGTSQERMISQRRKIQAVYKGALRVCSGQEIQLCLGRESLTPVDQAIFLVFAAHVPLHVRYVVVFGQVSVLLHVGTLVLRHACDEIVNDFVGNQ